MSDHTLPPVGQNSSQVSIRSKSETTPLKELAGRVSTVTEQIRVQLETLLYNETVAPDDVDVQLYDISKRIGRLPDNLRQGVQKLYKNVAFRAFFPIVGELYGKK